MRPDRRRHKAREKRALDAILDDLRRVAKVRFTHTSTMHDPEAVQHLIADGRNRASYACDTKDRYPTFNSAERARLTVERRLGKPMDVYACPFCRSYHLASGRKAPNAPAAVPQGFRFPTRFPQPSTLAADPGTEVANNIKPATRCGTG